MASRVCRWQNDWKLCILHSILTLGHTFVTLFEAWTRLILSTEKIDVWRTTVDFTFNHRMVSTTKSELFEWIQSISFSIFLFSSSPLEFLFAYFFLDSFHFACVCAATRELKKIHKTKRKHKILWMPTENIAPRLFDVERQKFLMWYVTA